MMSLPMKWILLDAGVGHELLERLCGHARRLALVEVILQAGEVADRRVEPDVEVLAGCVRDRDAEIGRVARDVPVAQSLLAFEPLARLVRHLGLELAVECPAPQEFHAALRGQPEEEVLGVAQLGRGARERRVRFDQFGGRVDRAADLAGVAVLVLGAAHGHWPLM